MVKKYKLNMGFTLVELLIVITLIAILAVAIVATLNPIEQINRARDARYKNDASELLGAIERYYTSTGQYPWMAEAVGGDDVTLEDKFAGTGTLAGVGVCGGEGVIFSGEGDCDYDGVLISSDELKSQFRNKDQFNGASIPSDHLYIYKEDGSSSVYICFIPIANVNRTPSDRVRLWDLTLGDGSLYSSITEVPPSVDYEEPTWTDALNSYFICVPE